MNKSVLKSGMIVRCVNGKMFYVDGRLLIDKNHGFYEPLEHYTDDLVNTINSNYNIVEVYTMTWQRKPEPKRMTIEELVESYKKHTGEDVEVEVI